MIDLIIISDTGMPYNINKQRSLRSVFWPMVLHTVFA